MQDLHASFTSLFPPMIARMGIFIAVAAASGCHWCRPVRSGCRYGVERDWAARWRHATAGYQLEESPGWNGWWDHVDGNARWDGGGCSGQLYLRGYRICRLETLPDLRRSR